MRDQTSLRGLLPGMATTAFVLLCAVDSAAGNQVRVPAPWLLLDAGVGVVGLVLGRRSNRPWLLGLAAVCTAAVGAALLQLVLRARDSLLHAQLVGAVLVLLTLLRWSLPWVSSAPYHHTWLGVVMAVLVVQCCIAWGRYFGAHDALVASLRSENAALLEGRRAAVEAARGNERLELAREMHDVLAHRLSLISIHSAALEHRRTMDDQERVRTGRLIRQNARASLDELRTILSGLREPQESGPMPDLADLPALMSQADTSRFPIDAHLDLPGNELRAGVGRHLYRITQEAITNAQKHGLPGPISIDVETTRSQLTITVTNRAGSPDGSDPGAGVKGITERVHLCGGQMTRSLDDGRHTLRVSVPIQEGR